MGINSSRTTLICLLPALPNLVALDHEAIGI
jgi:hypothetical protein